MTVPADSGPDAGTVIKTDRMGRMRFSRAQREKLLCAYEASEMSAVGFAEHHGIKYQTLATWIQRQRRARGNCQESKTEPSTRTDCVEVEMTQARPAEGSTPLVLNFPRGVLVVLSSADQVPVAAALLKAFTGGTDAELQR